MTIDEAIKHCLEVAKGKECKAKHYNRNAEREYNAEKSKYNIEKAEESLQCAADHRQLAEWLMELKDLRAEQNDQYVFIHELMSELKEAKRLLKAAVEAMNSEIGYCSKECKDCAYSPAGSRECEDYGYKWVHTDEAIKLIGGSENA